MYACTVFSNDGLTVKAPYPFCHSKAISFSPSQREELAFSFCTASSSGSFGGRAISRWMWWLCHLRRGLQCQDFLQCPAGKPRAQHVSAGSGCKDESSPARDGTWGCRVDSRPLGDHVSLTSWGLPHKTG